jgi:hypothetical protein
MMGILTYIKLGAVAAVILIAGYFYLDYSHLKKQNETLKYQVEQLEAASKYYEAQPEIDKHTQEMKNEIKKATDAGDLDRLRWLYQQLSKHKASNQGKAPRKARDGGIEQ